jgi:hypothetical protein
MDSGLSLREPGMTVLTVARVTSDLPDVSSARAKNISVFRKRKSLYGPPIPFSQEGRFAVVTSVGRGMRWTRQLQQTSVVAAYGKIVWS